MSQADPEAVSEADDPAWRLRWVNLAMIVPLAIAMATLYLLVRRHWEWAPFAYSVAASAVGAVTMGMGIAAGLRLPGIPSKTRVRLRHRQVLNPPQWLISGALAGSMAAILGTEWIPLALAVYVGLCSSGALIAYVVARRRYGAAPSDG